MPQRLPAADSWRRMNALLDEALMQPSGTRAAWLAARCDDDADLHRRMLDLLQRADTDTPWEIALQAPALWSELEQTLARGDMAEAADAPCGAWHLIRSIGRGGMADVFLGERESGGLVLRAAIKRLRPGHQGVEIERRFEREGRILARLEDERIARLLDAGVDAQGRAWLATEYIEGERIDRYCQRLGLGLDARLELFLDVAAAVAVAHRQLVVHRDIKPANVLVTGQGRVKLLDFGIAKLLHDSRELRDDDPPTRAELRVMTPEYAAPEQLLGHPIGTATDVYQLGVLLYELVTGVRPFLREGRTPAEFEQAVVAQSPPPPSTVATAAAARATRRLRRRLGGDLDAVILTALAKFPAQRYVSVDAFALDLRRWLDGRAVQARRIGRLRRAQLFARRHAVAVAAVAIVALLLVGYAVLATLQLRSIEREAQLNHSVREYLSDLFRDADPRIVRGRALDANAVLASGLERARTRFADQPLLLAELIGIGADVRSGQGDYGTALELIEEAIGLHFAYGRPDDPRRSWLLELQGRSLHYAGRYADAEAPLRESIDRCERASPRGVCLALASAADLMQSRGDYPEAERLLRRALQRAPADAPVRADLQRDLANVLRDQWRMDEARALYLSALEDLGARYDGLHLSLAATRVGYARLLAAQGDSVAAARLAQQAVDAHQRHFPDGHASPGISRFALGQAQAAGGHLDLAIATFDRVIESDWRSLPTRNVLNAYAKGDRGWVRLARGDLDGAESDFVAAIESYAVVSGQSHPRLAEPLIGRAALARIRGQTAAARELLAAALMLRIESFGSEHPHVEAARGWQRLFDNPAAVPAARQPHTEIQRMRWVSRMLGLQS